jgi:hypothetical protein
MLNRICRRSLPQQPFAPLVEQYRAIGPASLVAALICQPRPGCQTPFAAASNPKAGSCAVMTIADTEKRRDR